MAAKVDERLAQAFVELADTLVTRVKERYAEKEKSFGEPMMRAGNAFLEVNPAVADGVAELFFLGMNLDEQFVLQQF